MANNFGRVNVSITASTGGLSAGLASATKQLAGFHQAASDSTGSLANLSNSADDSGIFFTDLAGLFGSLGATLLGVGKSAGTAAVGIKVLGAAFKSLLLPLGVIAAVAAPFKAISDAASSLDNAGKSAERLGLSIGMFQTLSAVADEVGLSVSSMSSVLTKMQLTIVGASNGSKSAATSLRSLGLSLDELQEMSSVEQFAAISAAIVGIEDPAKRTAAAVAIFGKNAAAGMAFIKAGGSGAIAEMQALRQQFGVDITERQRQGINQMNDALGRLSIPLSGFINQLTSGLADGIATVARLILNFFQHNTAGWTLSAKLASGFTASLRYVSAAVTTLYGGFQLLWGLLATGQALLQQYLVAPMFRFLADWSGAIGAFINQVESAFLSVISSLSLPMQELLNLLAAGFDKIGQSGLAEQLRGTARSISTLSERSSGAGDAVASSADWARGMADAAEQSAATLAAQAVTAINDGLNNISNPFEAFDATMSKVRADANRAATEVENGLKAGGESVFKAVAASSKDLKAIVVGTTEGEAFRNSLMRGADPRLDVKEESRRTADATERTADAVEDLAAAGGMNLAIASIMV